MQTILSFVTEKELNTRYKLTSGSIDRIRLCASFHVGYFVV